MLILRKNATSKLKVLRKASDPTVVALTKRVYTIMTYQYMCFLVLANSFCFEITNTLGLQSETYPIGSAPKFCAESYSENNIF